MHRAEALRELGLPHDATDEDVRKRWRDISRAHHPDSGGDGDADALRRAQAARDAILGGPFALTTADVGALIDRAIEPLVLREQRREARDAAADARAGVVLALTNPVREARRHLASATALAALIASVVAGASALLGHYAIVVNTAAVAGIAGLVSGTCMWMLSTRVNRLERAVEDVETTLADKRSLVMTLDELWRETREALEELVARLLRLPGEATWDTAADQDFRDLVALWSHAAEWQRHAVAASPALSAWVVGEKSPSIRRVTVADAKALRDQLLRDVDALDATAWTWTRAAAASAVEAWIRSSQREHRRYWMSRHELIVRWFAHTPARVSAALQSLRRLFAPDAAGRPLWRPASALGAAAFSELLLNQACVNGVAERYEQLDKSGLPVEHFAIRLPRGAAPPSNTPGH